MVRFLNRGPIDDDDEVIPLKGSHRVGAHQPLDVGIPLSGLVVEYHGHIINNAKGILPHSLTSRSEVTNNLIPMLRAIADKFEKLMEQHGKKAKSTTSGAGHVTKKAFITPIVIQSDEEAEAAAAVDSVEEGSAVRGSAISQRSSIANSNPRGGSSVSGSGAAAPRRSEESGAARESGNSAANEPQEENHESDSSSETSEDDEEAGEEEEEEELIQDVRNSTQSTEAAAVPTAPEVTQDPPQQQQRSPTPPLSQYAGFKVRVSTKPDIVPPTETTQQQQPRKTLSVEEALALLKDDNSREDECGRESAPVVPPTAEEELPRRPSILRESSLRQKESSTERNPSAPKTPVVQIVEPSLFDEESGDEIPTSTPAQDSLTTKSKTTKHSQKKTAVSEDDSDSTTSSSGSDEDGSSSDGSSESDEDDEEVAKRSRKPHPVKRQVAPKLPAAKPKAAETSAIPTTAAELSKHTVVQLKDWLRSKGLMVSGTKQQLIDRLMQ
eukprot:PhF_6_TR26254/c1_g1_i2/m.37546